MEHISSHITDLTLILVVAGVVTLLFKKLRQPLVLGYIVAGFLVSPHMPLTMSVIDTQNIHNWANIGVMFLLFTLGLDFSMKKIVKMGTSPVIAAVTIIISMMVIGNLVGRAFGWSSMNCLFLGGMLAMSSTTIIYKAFNDMGLRQQKFSQMVMSVLILEDILAIVLMVMLAAIAGAGQVNTADMLQSVMKIGFFLVLWFVVGIFVIPALLRSTRKLMTGETLLVVSLGLCCLMAEISVQAGFSSAFGAFVMGSILAETIEAEKIIKTVEPVKNLFGAVFFVSVGMLVDPDVIVEYFIPIMSLVLAILIGQSVFGTIGFMLGGETLKSALRCGFSMAQIGEFSFIIASMGLTLGVISDFLYPVVVAVSVITTFLTPYMIRLSMPVYGLIEKNLPRPLVRTLNSSMLSRSNNSNKGLWKPLLGQLSRIVGVYSILSVALLTIMLSFVLPILKVSMPVTVAEGICALLSLLGISPFLRAMMMKKNKSEEFKTLWAENSTNRVLLVLTIVVRVVIASVFVFYVCNYLFDMKGALVVTVVAVVIIAIIMSRTLKRNSIRLERMFLLNLRSRDIAAQASGLRKPLFEGKLLDRDVHISEIEVPEDSLWAGKTLKELRLGSRFGVHVSSVFRGSHRINIPDGGLMIFPNDRLQIIGTDSQLEQINRMANTEIMAEDTEIEKHEMQLGQIVVSKNSSLVGKKLSESGIREKHNCMVVGIEEIQEALTQVGPSYVFKVGDVVWVVGEKNSLEEIANC